MKNFEHYLKKIKEGFDPSKSSSPDAPWNQTSFTEQNEDMLEYAEEKLGYTKDEIENFMSGDGYNAWETDIENLWPDLYMRTLTKGYDEEHDTPIYNDAYKKIEAEVKKSAGADYKKFKYELKKALDKYVVDTCLEDLRNLYLNHIPKNESTTFNVPTLIQLFYVEDANQKAVGLYKDLETAEKLEMQSKGKKYIINVDRDEYNNGKINASNAKYYIKKNEAGELVPVQAGEVIKLQKPAADTFTNSTINNDGAEIADCTVCGATGVVVGDHICKTVVEPMAQVDSEYNMVERFGSIRKKYGVNESKMITKIDWFRVILESPDNNDMKRNDSNKDLSSTPEEIARESQRLFDRYTDDQDLKQDIHAMFPDFRTIESEDATNHVLDTIYDKEGMTDNKWLALKPSLFTKFKSYFENEAVSESNLQNSDYPNLETKFSVDELISNALKNGTKSEVKITDRETQRLSARYHRKKVETYNAEVNIRAHIGEGEDAADYSIVLKQRKWVDEDPDGASGGTVNTAIFEDCSVFTDLEGKDLMEMSISKESKQLLDDEFAGIKDYMEY